MSAYNINRKGSIGTGIGLLDVASGSSTLLNNLIAYYNFDEASGNLLDQVASYDGTVVGATYSATGKIGTAYTFDGVNDYVNIDTVLTPLASTTQGTWAAWVKPVDATPISTYHIITFGDTNGDEVLRTHINTSGNLVGVCRISGTTYWALRSDNVDFTSGAWSHIAIVHNGVAPVIYVDGVAVAQSFVVSTDKTKFFSDATALDNGRTGCLNQLSGGNTDFFNGEIDEVGIWSRALTADEITELYNSNVGKTHPFSAADANALNSGLVSYYKLDDASGNAIDEVNQLDGTVVGATYSATGKIGTAYTFDGVNDYVNIGDIGSGWSGLTVCAWIYITSLPTGGIQAIVAKYGGTAATQAYYLTTYDNGADDTTQLRYFIDNGSVSKGANASTNLSINTWYHAVFTWDGADGRAKLYLNGSEDLSELSGVTGTIRGTTQSAAIGVRNIATPSAYFNGNIDEVGIWSRALTSAEITELYNLNVGKTHPFSAADANALNSGLVSYYKLDDASGNAIDEVNQLDGTVVGATYSATGKIGTAYTFDGVNDYVDISAAVGINNLAQGDMTISAWVKHSVNTPSTPERIACKRRDNTLGGHSDGWIFNINTSNVLSFTTVVTGTNAKADGTTSLNDNVWHHCVAVYTQSSRTVKIYVDAVDETTATTTGAAEPQDESSESLKLGTDFLVTGFLESDLDEVGIWSRALTPAEITELYNLNVGKTHPFT